MWTVDETRDSLFTYGFSYDDYIRISFNIIYHFGNIYDRTHEIIQIFALQMVESLSANEWIYIGYLLGNIFYQIFNPA
jgi:hypothetical protein